MMSNYLIKALAYCEETLQDQSENQAKWEMNCRKIGNILQSMGWFDEALLWHSRLLESQQNLGEIYQDLAKLYTRLEKWEEAISVYEKLLNIKPDDIETYFNLSKIYVSLGDKEKEIECLFQMLNIKPTKVKPEGYYKLGKEFENIGKNDRAITCYLRSIQNEPHLLSAYYNLAQIYISEGHWEKAIDIYHQLLEQDEKQPLAYYKIGLLWWDNFNYEVAIDYLSKAAVFDNSLADSYFNFAITLNQKQESELVIKFCRALIRAKIVYPWTYIQLANALVEKGDLADISLCYQQAGKLRGWDDCVKNNYQFTKDFFNYKIDILKLALQPLINQPLLNALEIDCLEGMSTCWLLDNILTEATAKLTCVDPKFSELFKENIEKTGVKNKVTLLEGNLIKILSELSSLSFDLINIQDKGKKAKRVKEITELVWKLAKKDSIIIFNNYSSQPSQEKTPKDVIDSFLENQNVQILYQGQILIIKKLN